MVAPPTLTLNAVCANTYVSTPDDPAFKVVFYKRLVADLRSVGYTVSQADVDGVSVL